MHKRLGVVAAVAASALLIAGCAASPGANPTSPPEVPQEYPLEVAWLDDGRSFAVITYGSSSCVPAVEEATAEGQEVSVVLAAPDEAQICTTDYAPRATLAPLPEGVDPTQDVEVVLYDPLVLDIAARTVLGGNEALTGSGGESTDFEPSAGWFSDDGLVLLTWGSSTCPPLVGEIEESEDAATVHFVTEQRACTMDMAPRLTVLGFGEQHDQDAFVLTLSGDGFEAVDVRPISR